MVVLNVHDIMLGSNAEPARCALVGDTIPKNFEA